LLPQGNISSTKLSIDHNHMVQKVTQHTKPVAKRTKAKGPQQGKSSPTKAKFSVDFCYDGQKMNGKGNTLLDAFNSIQGPSVLKVKGVLRMKSSKRELERLMYPFESKRFFGNEMKRIAMAKFYEIALT